MVVSVAGGKYGWWQVWLVVVDCVSGCGESACRNDVVNNCR